jgi:hypothetical protein
MKIRAFFLSVLEIVALALTVLPLHPEIDTFIRTMVFQPNLARHLAKTGIFGRDMITSLATQEADWQPSIEFFLREMGPEALILLGVGIFLWFELSLPGQFFSRAQYANLTGSILEVRQDMTLKISLGEERGVLEGMIFQVEKRKHVDQLSQGAFRTMIMAPQVFAIGEAKVTSVAPDFALCKFRRIQGQSSSPSAKDRVVILRRP